MKEKIEFSEIKGWVSIHLSKQNNLILGNNTQDRTVIVNSMKGPVVYSIPKKTPETITQFKDAWIKVYIACLDYLNKRVSDLFKKNLLKMQDDNTVIVDDRKFVFTDDMDNITYINTLEDLCIAYENMHKKKEDTPISYNKATVKISKPDNFKVSKIDSKQIVVPSIKKEDTTSTKVVFKRKEIYDNYFTASKLSDGERISIKECGRYASCPIVFLTCTNLKKGDGVFRDNAEVFSEKLPSVLKAAFITGRAIKVDQASKEVQKIVKLCRYGINTNIIMYEVNNEAIQSMGENKNVIEKAIKALEKVFSLLEKKEYKVLICMDPETLKTIEKVDLDIPDYPIFFRVLPRQIDMINSDSNLIVMDPQFDNDMVVIKDKKLVTDLNLSTKL